MDLPHIQQKIFEAVKNLIHLRNSTLILSEIVEIMHTNNEKREFQISNAEINSKLTVYSKEIDNNSKNFEMNNFENDIIETLKNLVEYKDIHYES